MPSYCSICITKQAKYGYERGKRLYCKKCKTSESVNFDDVCIEDNCSHTAIYNYLNLKPKYCYLHKNNQMGNLRNIMCSIEGCKKTASFGYSKINYCFKHKSDDMSNIKSNQRNISNKRRREKIEKESKKIKL